MAVTNSGMTLYIHNDSDTGWTGEDGTSTEVFWQGTGSQAWIVGKSSSETATLTLSADFSASKYLTFGMLSTIAPFYTTIKMQLESTTSNYEEFTLSDAAGAFPVYRAIAGEFITSAPSIEFGQGTQTGTYVPGSHTILRITVDNTNSGNIRSVENHYIDAMYHGDGRSIGGTTVGDKLFTESDELNVSADVLDCCTMIFGGEVFAQTDLYITTTSGNSYGETVVFRNVPNTSNSYTLTVTGTADFQATTVKSADTAVTTNIDTSGATSFQMLGGAVVGLGTTAFAASQTIDAVVFTDRTSITHSAANFENCIVNTSGLMTVSSTGTCTNNTFNKATGTSAILVADLTHAPTNTFISDGSGHAVELSSIGGGSMTWSGSTTLYDSGSAGSPITPTSTGNEDIYVNVTTASDFTINVAAGATIPSVRVSAGFTGVVNVVAGAIDVTANAALKDGTPVGSAVVYLKASDATGPFPFEELVSITRSGTLATVTHVLHGMASNDKIVLEGITDKVEDNYVIKQITVTSASTYTYTTTDSGSVSYTGTIFSTFVALSGLTDGSGVLTLSRTYPANQPVVGWTRKSTSSPFLQEGVLVGIVDSTDGFNGTAVMLSDE